MLTMTKSLRTNFLPRSYFLEQLWREKHRAERTNNPLSIVLFHFNFDKENSAGSFRENFEIFLKPFQDGIRETDILGYLTEHVIGLLLPDTNEQGTEELMNKLFKGQRDLPFLITTSTYPSEIFENLLKDNRSEADTYPFFLEDFAEPNQSEYRLKKSLDLIGALICLIIFLPIMLVAAIAIKLNSPGPIIFKQIRLGKRGIPFVFYKFRSMYCNTDDKIHREYVANLIKGNLETINQGDQVQPLYKIKADPRVTWVGKIIRKTSIDELPQLINVLKGDMSLVGPRPPLPYEVDKYQPWHLRRILESKPGITGLWQVEGRSKTSFDDMVRLDIRYIQNCSLVLDLVIIFKTIKVVLQSSGAV